MRGTLRWIDKVVGGLGLLGMLLWASATSAADEAPGALTWQRGPTTAPIGDDLAEIDLSEDYVYLDAAGTRKLMELTQNPVSGSEVATVAPVSEDAGWFLIFEFDDVGYVADDEKDALDADAMLASVRKSNDAANEERRSRGWQTMEIVGWQEKPHYDERTNNLSWAIIGASAGHQNVNRIVKVLGRRGVMTATLVSSPEELVAATQTVDALLDGYRYRPGHTYAEYVPGTDKLASYGLTALVVGGGAAALAKSGVLARLWKPIAVALAGLGAALKRMFMSGRSAQHDLEHPIG